jgi:hypothetical protein
MRSEDLHKPRRVPIDLALEIPIPPPPLRLGHRLERLAGLDLAAVRSLAPNTPWGLTTMGPPAPS